jgi:hypothetical protein
MAPIVLQKILSLAVDKSGDMRQHIVEALVGISKHGYFTEFFVLSREC